MKQTETTSCCLPFYGKSGMTITLDFRKSSCSLWSFEPVHIVAIRCLEFAKKYNVVLIGWYIDRQMYGHIVRPESPVRFGAEYSNVDIAVRTRAYFNEKKRAMSKQIDRILVLLSLATGTLMIGCNPTVKIQAPDKPIVINLNIKIDHEIRIKVDRELDYLLESKQGLF